MKEDNTWIKWMISKVRFLMIILILESIILQNLIVTHTIFVRSEKIWLSVIDKVINSSVLIIIILVLPVTLKNLWVAFFLCFHRYWCRHCNWSVESDAKPMSILRMKGNLEYMSKNFIYTEYITELQQYSSFGKLPSKLRSPIVILIFNLLGFISFWLQSCITALSWWDNKPAYSYVIFSPFLIAAVTTGILPILLDALLRWYHKRLSNKV